MRANCVGGEWSRPARDRRWRRLSSAAGDVQELASSARPVGQKNRAWTVVRNLAGTVPGRGGLVTWWRCSAGMRVIRPAVFEPAQVVGDLAGGRQRRGRLLRAVRGERAQVGVGEAVGAQRQRNTTSSADSRAWLRRSG